MKGQVRVSRARKVGQDLRCGGNTSEDPKLEKKLNLNPTQVEGSVQTSSSPEEFLKISPQVFCLSASAFLQILLAFCHS